MGVANQIAKGMLLHNAWSLCHSSSPWASEHVWQDSGGALSEDRPASWGRPWLVPSLGQATLDVPSKVVHGNKGSPLEGPLICRSEHKCLCGPILVSSAGDAGCSDSGFTDPECWLILRSHKGCRLLWIAGRWP